MGTLCSSHKDLPLPPEDAKVVMLVHGMASCGLYAKEKEGGQMMVKLKGDSGRKLERGCWLSLKELAKLRFNMLEVLILTHREFSAHDGSTVLQAVDRHPGREVLVREGLDGISTLNPGEKIPLVVWKGLVDHFRSDYRLSAFTYDWRRWGDQSYADELVVAFRKSIEKSARASGDCVPLVAHSMGASVILYCLGVLGPAWTKKHVEQLVLIAPAATGSPAMFAAYPCGPLASVCFAVAPGIEKAAHALLRASSSWPCMIAEFPATVGGVQVYPPDQVFAVTPSRKYYQKDVQQFLDDVATCAKTQALRNFDTEVSEVMKDEEGRAMLDQDGKHYRSWTTTESLQGGKLFYPGVQNMNSMMAPPVVPTHIIYSAGVDTLTCSKFVSDDLLQIPHSEFEPGDDTVTADSVERLAKAWIDQEIAEVHLHKVPGKVAHKGLLDCDYTLKLLSTLLGDGDESPDGVDDDFEASLSDDLSSDD